MATGKCVNIMRCSKAKAKEIQEADKANFVCAECGKPLVECGGVPGPEPEVNKNGGKGNTGRGGTVQKPYNWKPIAIIAAAVIVIAAGIVWFMNSGNGGNDEGTGVPPTETTIVETPPTETTIVETPPAEEPKPIDKAKVKKVKVKTPAPKPWASYATFDGTTMTFTRTHTIPGTSRVAKPGDRVQGVWKNGEVNSVRWYHADGTPSEHLTHE